MIRVSREKNVSSMILLCHVFHVMYRKRMEYIGCALIICVLVVPIVLNISDMSCGVVWNVEKLRLYNRENYEEGRRIK